MSSEIKYYVVVEVCEYCFIVSELNHIDQAINAMENLALLASPPMLLSTENLVEMYLDKNYKVYNLKGDNTLLNSCYSSISDGFYTVGIIEENLFINNLCNIDIK